MSRPPAAIILDIEGTTTPISFVYDVLFPYARDHAAGYLAARFGRRIPGKYVRRFVLAVGFLLSAYFFFTTHRV